MNSPPPPTRQEGGGNPRYQEALRTKPKASSISANDAGCPHQARHPQIGDVRGLGPMLALEFVRDAGLKLPAPEIATAVAGAALRRGLLVLKAGIHGNCLRVLVALVATDEQIEESLDVFAEAVAEALAATAPMAAATL